MEEGGKNLTYGEIKIRITSNPSEAMHTREWSEISNIQGKTTQNKNKHRFRYAAKSSFKNKRKILSQTNQNLLLVRSSLQEMLKEVSFKKTINQL